MRQWQCKNIVDTQKDINGKPTLITKCKFQNQEMAMCCKKCGSSRPKETIPKDIIFPFYIPFGLDDPSNYQIIKMEQLLNMIPLVDYGRQSLIDVVKEHKQKEKGKKDNMNFDRIKIIEDFLDMWSAKNFEMPQQEEMNDTSNDITNNSPGTGNDGSGSKAVKQNGEEEDIWIESPEEILFYENLCKQI